MRGGELTDHKEQIVQKPINCFLKGHLPSASLGESGGEVFFVFPSNQHTHFSRDALRGGPFAKIRFVVPVFVEELQALH